jgi:hypothetical protein
VLRYAVLVSPSGISLQLVGLVLLVVGGIGLGISVALEIARFRERAVARRQQLEQAEERSYAQGRADERARQPWAHSGQP